MWKIAIAAILASTLLSSVAAAESPWAETARDEDLEVKLVTFGPGDAVHQYFGHNALIVEDTQRGMAAMYNFGMFNFGPDMLPKYLQGQLEFWAIATGVRRTYAAYRTMNRSIRVRELDLRPEKRRWLAERLSWHVQPENRAYRYHHYRDNCSTKVRDLIDGASGGLLGAQHSKPARLTYRGHTWRYTEHDPIIHMLLVFWMNDSMERPIQEMHEAFLPDELEKLVDATLIEEGGRKRPLVKRAYTLFEARRAPVAENPSPRWPSTLGLGLLLGGVALLLAWLQRRHRDRFSAALFGLHHVLLGILCGVPGLVAGLFLLTEWKVTHWNENLFLCNPVTFLSFPLGLMLIFGSRWARRWLARAAYLMAASSLLLLVLKLLPNFDQQVWLPMALMLPANVGFALAHRLLEPTKG
ncbi:MAG: DUF4105 domain-containing protein [Myxococcales bacterium]|nr:DUF4105 domain-containing protein [Myxococcales bacterium]